MSNDDDNSTWGKIKISFFCLLFMAVGMAMIAFPHASAGDHQGGGVLKHILIFLWGRPCGFILEAVCALALWGTWSGTSDAQPELVRGDQDRHE